MFTELYWIDGPWPGRLAISARPRGGDWLEEEIRAWRAAGVDTVVSLLMPVEMDDLGLQREAEVCRKNGVEFLSFPIVDRSIPTLDSNAVDLFEQIEAGAFSWEESKRTLPPGNWTLGAGSGQLIGGERDIPSGCHRAIGKARRATVPETPEQRAWIDAFAATLSPAGQRLRP